MIRIIQGVRPWEPDPKPNRGGRPRVYYELTAEGTKVAQEERETLMHFMGLGAAKA
jgi:PadR family transcriptional regulator PadR